MADEKKKTCVIGFKIGVFNGLKYGERFDSLDPCCEEFNQAFFKTGKMKRSIFSGPIDQQDRNGFNFEKEGDTWKLFLVFFNPYIRCEMKFCLFCGSGIKIQKIKTVRLKEKMVSVQDGFSEEVVDNFKGTGVLL